MAKKLAGLAVGLVFGFTIVWSGMTSPNVIRGALLFEQSYLFLFMCSAMATATIGLFVLKRIQFKALLTGEVVSWKPDTIERRHITGALMFGIGWGVADVCPGPIATQVGQGIAWSLLTLAGVVFGVYTYLKRGNQETEPAAEKLTNEKSAPIATRTPAPVS